MATKIGNGWITIVDLNDGEKGEKGEPGADGADGKDGVTVVTEGAPLTFATDESGVVSSTATATAKVRLLRGGKNVTSEVTSVQVDGTNTVNCTPTVSKGTDSTGAYISISVNGGTIAKTTVSGLSVSVTAGCAGYKYVLDGVQHTGQIGVQVDVAAYTGGLTATTKSLTAKYTEISNKQTDLAETIDGLPLKTDAELTEYTSTIEQTAREIALKVGRTVVGRRNLWKGSELKKRDGGTYLFKTSSALAWIETTDGVDGKNSCHVQLSSGQWAGVCQSGDNGSSCVRVESGKTYTVGVWVKADSTNVRLQCEVHFADSADTLHANMGSALKTISWTVGKTGEWALVTGTFSVPSSATTKYVEVLIVATHSQSSYTRNVWMCMPSVTEGAEYAGWTRSEKDVDYIGGNLLDSTRQLAVTGNLTLTRGTVEADGVANMLSLTTSSTYTTVLYFEPTLESGEYVFACDVRGSGNMILGARYSATGGSCAYETNEGTTGTVSGSGYKGVGSFALDGQWRRIWTHLRVTGTMPSALYVQLSNAGTIEVRQPKLEVEATATAWTDSATGFVEDRPVGAKLLDTGIDIEAGQMTFTADNSLFRTNTGTQIAAFTNEGLNTSLVKASRLMATGESGLTTNIEGGVAEFCGTNGVANIRIGLDDDGVAILEIYNRNGQKIYDLGPNGLQKIEITKGTLSAKNYVKWTSLPISEDVTYKSKNGTVTVTRRTVTSANASTLFGTKKVGDLVVTGNATMVYLYSAPTVNGVVQADSAHGLTTQALAQQADGKYFTSTTLVKNGALANLATGTFIIGTETVRDAMAFDVFLLGTGDSISVPDRYFGGLLEVTNGVADWDKEKWIFARTTREVKN